MAVSVNFSEQRIIQLAEIKFWTKIWQATWILPKCPWSVCCLPSDHNSGKSTLNTAHFKLYLEDEAPEKFEFFPSFDQACRVVYEEKTINPATFFRGFAAINCSYAPITVVLHREWYNWLYSVIKRFYNVKKRFYLVVKPVLQMLVGPIKPHKTGQEVYNSAWKAIPKRLPN